jgi:MFS family permease
MVYLGFALVRQPERLWPLFAAYGLYSAFTEGVEKALVAEIAPLQQRATLIGLHATLVGIGLFPASLLAGLLWTTVSPAAPFYFGGAIGILTALGLQVVLQSRSENSFGA